MSDVGPELPQDEAFAAEHALGVLDARARGQAEARMAADPEFARMVEAWRERLSGLLAALTPVAPPTGLWPRIERALPASDVAGPGDAANDNVAGLRRTLNIWRTATVGALTLTAASLAALMVMVNRPPVVIQSAPAPGQLLNASLATQKGQPLFVAAYDPDRQALIITSLVPPGTDPLHVHQLWLIPEDGRMRSLGMVEPGVSKTMPMPDSMARMVAEGAQLAVSVEAPGGSVKPDGPSGPVAAQGKLGKI